MDSMTEGTSEEYDLDDFDEAEFQPERDQYLEFCETRNIELINAENDRLDVHPLKFQADIRPFEMRLKKSLFVVLKIA
jgi:hypothetical protein